MMSIFTILVTTTTVYIDNVALAASNKTDYVDYNDDDDNARDDDYVFASGFYK